MCWGVFYLVVFGNFLILFCRGFFMVSDVRFYIRCYGYSSDSAVVEVSIRYSVGSRVRGRLYVDGSYIHDVVLSPEAGSVGQIIMSRRLSYGTHVVELSVGGTVFKENVYVGMGRCSTVNNLPNISNLKFFTYCSGSGDGTVVSVGIKYDIDGVSVGKLYIDGEYVKDVVLSSESGRVGQYIINRVMSEGMHNIKLIVGNRVFEYSFYVGDGFCECGNVSIIKCSEYIDDDKIVGVFELVKGDPVELYIVPVCYAGGNKYTARSVKVKIGGRTVVKFNKDEVLRQFIEKIVENDKETGQFTKYIDGICLCVSGGTVDYHCGDTIYVYRFTDGIRVFG